MIERLTLGAFRAKESQYPPYKMDRRDVYTVTYIIDDVSTLDRIISYDVVEVNCYPDNDW